MRLLSGRESVSAVVIRTMLLEAIILVVVRRFNEHVDTTPTAGQYDLSAMSTTQRLARAGHHTPWNSGAQLMGPLYLVSPC